MAKTKNEKEEFIRVGTTLYKLVNQPRLNGGYVKKRIVWNNETLRQDYGKDYVASLCFGCTETACYPPPISKEVAFRWSIQYNH